MTTVLDWSPEVSEFELQLSYYVTFRTNTPGKGIYLFDPPVMDWIVSQLFFCKDGFGINNPCWLIYHLTHHFVLAPLENIWNPAMGE